MARPRKIPLGRVRDAALVRLEYARRSGRGCGEKRVVAIVGMHRSGTSAVAGTLQEAGLYLGSVLRKKYPGYNAGTREHLGIVALHDEILAHSGGSWFDPPERIAWTGEHVASRERIIQSFAGAELWGFKDPRTVLLLDFWREALGDSLALVGVFREPAAVVASLVRRNGGPGERWFGLWSRYNEPLLLEHDAAAFPLIEFGPSAERFREQVSPVLTQLGLRERRLSFFDASLSSTLDPTVAVPPRPAQLYELLRNRQCALSPPVLGRDGLLDTPRLSP